MSSIAVGGRTRYFDVEGEGPAVILVHGSLSSARQWRKLSERLRGRFRVLMPDLYACGPDDVVSNGASSLGAFSFEEDCAFVRRLIEMAGGGVSLLGHSYGGVVAIKAALLRREALANLILIEPSCFHLLEQERQPEYAEVMDLRAFQQGSAQAGDMTASARGFIDYWMGQDAWASMPESRRQTIVLGVPKVAEDWRGTLEHHTTLADYGALSVRTLVMRARDTRAPSFRLADMIAGALPNSERAEIACGGHMSPLTNPDAVNDAVERFLDGKIA